MRRKIGSYSCLRLNMKKSTEVVNVEITRVVCDGQGHVAGYYVICVDDVLDSNDLIINKDDQRPAFFQKKDLISLKQAKRLAVARAKREIRNLQLQIVSFEAKIEENGLK